MGENNSRHEKRKRIYISNKTTEEEEGKENGKYGKDVSHIPTD